MKVVVNNQYGGFWLLDAAYEKLIAMGWTVTTYNERGELVDPEADIVDIVQKREAFMGRYAFGKWDEDGPELRSHPDLVAVVEELGEAASRRWGDLVIVDIPDDVQWHIEEYDGLEWVAEDHRTWPERQSE